jgi:hypothetical protein
MVWKDAENGTKEARFVGVALDAFSYFRQNAAPFERCRFLPMQQLNDLPDIQED